MEELLIDNKYKVNFYRKKIKNINLTILPDCTIRISAPLKTKVSTIEDIVRAKKDWIDDKIEKYSKQAKLREDKKFISGETHYYLGEKYILNTIKTSNKNHAEISNNSINLYIKQNSTIEERKKAIYEYYKNGLYKQVQELFKIWEPKMGVKVGKLKIRKMKTIWGSCNIKTGDITINLELAKKANKEIEYVVVHEMTHLLEKSHNKRFKNLMTIFLPDWKKRKEVLNNAIYE